jgi:hypothetical protein
MESAISYYKSSIERISNSLSTLKYATGVIGQHGAHGSCMVGVCVCLLATDQASGGRYHCSQGNETILITG